MAVTDNETIDGIAFENEVLILEIYDHLPFDEKFEFDHIDILQDKLNVYLWYIESKQYIDTYPNREFKEFIINIHFLNQITINCQKYIDISNKKMLDLELKTKIIPIFKGER